MVNTQTLPKPDHSQKTMVQYSNRAKACHLSEKDGTILKQSQNLIKVRKKVQYSNRSKTCHRPEKDGTILKQCSEPKPVTSQKKVQFSNSAKPANSQKKMVQYSNRAKTC